jgi:hypothetical protein
MEKRKILPHFKDFQNNQIETPIGEKSKTGQDFPFFLLYSE